MWLASTKRPWQEWCRQRLDRHMHIALLEHSPLGSSHHAKQPQVAMWKVHLQLSYGRLGPFSHYCQRARHVNKVTSVTRDTPSKTSRRSTQLRPNQATESWKIIKSSCLKPGSVTQQWRAKVFHYFSVAPRSMPHFLVSPMKVAHVYWRLPLSPFSSSQSVGFLLNHGIYISPTLNCDYWMPHSVMYLYCGNKPGLWG